MPQVLAELENISFEKHPLILNSQLMENLLQSYTSLRLLHIPLISYIAGVNLNCVFVLFPIISVTEYIACYLVFLPCPVRSAHSSLQPLKALCLASVFLAGL